jgi:hypothetical protein
MGANLKRSNSIGSGQSHRRSKPKGRALSQAVSFEVEALEGRQLLSGGSISGYVNNDPTGHGIAGTAAVGLLVYLDLPGLDAVAFGDPVATTDATGHYAFNNLAAGKYLVRLVPRTTQVTTSPVWGGKYFVSLATNQVITGENFLNEVITTPSFRLTNGQALVSGVANGQATLSRFNVDTSVDTTYGTLGTLNVPNMTGLATSITSKPDGSLLVTYAGGKTAALTNVGTLAASPIVPIVPILPNPNPPGGATISGTIYNDANGNGSRDAGESAMAGQQLYLDLQGLDAFSAGDPVATTDSSGNYSFPNLAPGSYLVRPLIRATQVITSPVWGGKYYVPLATNQQVSGDDFGMQTVTTPSFSWGSQLLVAGSANGQSTLSRFNADGSVDVGFGALGVARLPGTVGGQPTRATPQPNGSVIIAYPTATVTLSATGTVLSVVANAGISLNDPTGLMITATSSNSVSLAFTDNATNEQSHLIERSGSSSSPWATIATIAGTGGTGAVSFVDTSVAPGSTYYYRVYAVGAGTTSNIAGPVTASTPPATVGGAIRGTVFDDANGNGLRDAGENPVVGQKVYLDLQGLGTFATGDPIATTDASGAYSFTNLAASNYLVRLLPQPGRVVTSPLWGAKYFLQLSSNQVATGEDFGSESLSRTNATQVDGKILLADATGYQITRFNVDGSVDLGFGSLGTASLHGVAALISIVPTADGLITLNYADKSSIILNGDGSFNRSVTNPDGTIVTGADVLTYHNNLSADGQANAETILTPANVRSSTFGKVFSTPVDGQIYAQPLFKSGVTITTGSQQGVRNVTFVATEHDSIYAINADTGSVLWQTSFINPSAGVTSIPAPDTGTNVIAPEIGITGTPVIDGATNTLYAVALTKEIIAGQSHYFQRLHAIDLGSGAEKFGAPVVIADTMYDGTTYTYVSGPAVAGTGDGSVNGTVNYNALRQNQRPALSLINGVVYIASASFGDVGPFHGWLLGYRAADLSLTSIFNDSPNGSDGGIWESGAGVSADADGNLYLVTGNGTFDSTFNPDGTPALGNYGDAVLKLAVDTSSSAQQPNINGYGLKVVDYYVPQNYQILDSTDKDLGSSGVLMLPDSAGSALHPHLLMVAGKDGRMFLLDRDHLGGLDAQGDHAVQIIANNPSGIFSTPAYFKGSVYVAGNRDTGKAYAIANGALSATPTAVSIDYYGYPGSTPSVSSNAGANGIVWDINPAFSQFRAYAASDLTELFTSDQVLARDQLGPAVKFRVPTIANGRVFVPTMGALVGYGLLLKP